MKRYTSREKIIKDIDGALKRVASAKRLAQEYLDDEELLTGTSAVDKLRKAREAADFQFRKIKRLENVRLPALKAKLAEFDTSSLPGISLDNGCSPASPQHQPEPASASSDGHSTIQSP